MSQKTKIINNLTQLINQNPNNLSVRDVLSNCDLCSSVENEVPELLDFFCPMQPSPPSAERSASLIGKYKLQEDRQKELSLLALSSEFHQMNKKYEYDDRFNFSKNASSVISSSFKQFHDGLVYYYSDGNGNYTPSPFLDQLIKFSRSIKSSSSFSQTSLFCGNFSRIFESIVQTSKGQLFEIIYKLAPDLNPFYSVILKLIYLTSIRQLFITCLILFPQKFINQNLPDFFIELAKFGAHHSNHIRSKKEKDVKEIYVDTNILYAYSEQFNILEPQDRLDEVGFPIKVRYHDDFKLDKDDVRKNKKSRYDHFRLVIASVLIFRDILDHHSEIVNYMCKNEVIESLLKIAINSPESTFVVSLTYKLILRIITSGHRSLNDFSDILNQKEFLPDIYVLPDLKKRIENDDCEFKYHFAGEHLIYQLPLYFFKIPSDVHNLFFYDKKYSLIFDRQFVFTIKNVLSKKEQIEYFIKDDNAFLKKLCKALPDPPNLDLELPDLTVHNPTELLPEHREPLQSFLWDIAYYIDDCKRFSFDDIPFKKGKKWRMLHNKVKEYYSHVYEYVGNPDDDNGEIDNEDEIEEVVEKEMNSKDKEEIENIKKENEKLKAKINGTELENATLKEKADQLQSQINEIEIELLSTTKENSLLKDEIAQLQEGNKKKKPSKSDEMCFIGEDEENEFHINAGKIGEGGTSITYKIIDKRTKTPMCKKVLKYKDGQTEIKDLKRTMNEFQILHNISHPCICKALYINTAEPIEIASINDFENDDQQNITTVAIFLEFIKYGLADVLKMKIDNTLKTRIVLDIVHAMKFLHKNGMMHRDLKIENIMLTSFFETKLVDFGLVRISESVFNEFSYVEDSMTKGIGTLSYMSPEMMNEEEYDYKTDVYSFGVVLHVMFVGSLPKLGMKDKLAGKKINLPPPSKLISSFCIELISKCMNHSPLERPSFEDILNLMRENSYELASNIDPSILAKRDKELDEIENIE